MGVTVTSKKGQLYVSFTTNNQRKLFAVRPTVKATPAQLDTEAVAIRTGNRKHDKELNLILQKNYFWFLETVERVEKYEKRQATIALISKLHEEEFLTEKKSIPLTFNTAFEAYIDHKRDVEGIKGKSLLQYSENFAKRLKTFLSRYKYRNLDELDEHFLNRFNKHLLDLNYSKATYSLTTNIFKNFTKYLLNEKLISADSYYQCRDILKSKPYTNIKDFALTLDEVKEIHDFTDVTQCQLFYKDLFIFNCIAGGMRYSDLSKVMVGDVDLQSKFLHVYTQKNKSYVTIPILPLAEEIIRKWNPDIETTSDHERKLFRVGNNLKNLNERLKLVAKSFYRMIDGVKVYPYRVHKQELIETANKGQKLKYKYLYEFFKSSLCRRTFISILLEQQYTFEQIRLYTGHKSYKGFSAYPKLSQKSKVEVLHKAFATLSMS